MKRPDSVPVLFVIIFFFLEGVSTACKLNSSLVVSPSFTHSTTTGTVSAANQTATFTTQIADTTVTPMEVSSPTVDYFSPVYPLSSNDYVIPLTVRHTTQRQTILFFELRNPTSGKLVYRNLVTGIQSEISLPETEMRHMITISELTPGTEYEALVLLGSEENDFQQPTFAGNEWGSIKFRTVPDDWPLKFGVLGDASFGDQATQQLVELMAAQELNFVIHTGDVVYETNDTDIFNSYLNKFFIPFSPLLHKGPIYTVLGNHDYDPAVGWQGAPFYDYVFPSFADPDFTYPENRRGNQYYAFAYQDVQFVMLDTHVFAGAEGRAEQDAWLDQRLMDSRLRITIPVFHAAPYSSSIVHPDDGLPIRYSWNWRFENARVPVVLSGHFHHYERLVVNDITYIVTGGGSSVLYAQGELLPGSQIYARKTHFVLLEIYQDHIDLKAIALDGDIIDQARIE